MRKGLKHLARSSDGAVMLLAVLCIIVFFLFAAFAIDVTAAASRMEQNRQHMKFAALAALERYYSTDGDNQEKLQAALERANEILQLNVSLFVDGETRTTIGTGESNQSAQLEPGRWYFTKPSGGNFDVCSSYPCFEPTQENPNAFHIEGQLYGDYRPLFMRAISSDWHPVAIRGSATASVIPRHGCFLIDLSPSVTRETHRPGGQGNSFAYLLARDNTGMFYNPLGSHETGFNHLETFFPFRNPENLTVPTQHYANDYQLFSLLADGNFLSGTDNYGHAHDYSEHHPNPFEKPEYGVTSVYNNYRIDTFRDAAVYDGPQPLKTIMDALKALIDKFRERQVAGDKVCLIFFSHSLTWPSVVNLTDDFDYLQELLDWNHVGDKNQGFERALLHGLFPQANGYTDLQMAMEEAMHQFAQAQVDGVPSSDFITIISDGEVNCVTCPQPVQNNADGCIYNHLCDDRPDVWFLAMKQLKNYVRTTIYPTQIPVHVMLVGENVRPHTIDIPSSANPDQCITEEQARSQGKATVQGLVDFSCTFQTEYETFDCTAKDPFSGAAYSDSDVRRMWRDIFLGVNDAMYGLAEMTGGIWAPIRPGIPGCSPQSEPPKCGARTGMDDTGRRIYDPFCRSTYEQMLNYIDQMLGQNPYTIVGQ